MLSPLLIFGSAAVSCLSKQNTDPSFREYYSTVRPKMQAFSPNFQIQLKKGCVIR